MTDFNRYSIRNNNYQIFKIEESPEGRMIHFLWGKHDFKVYTKDSKSIESLQLKLKGKWYVYCGISSHGTMFEETKWKDEEGVFEYIETPSKLTVAVKELISLVMEDNKLSEVS